MFTIIDNEIYQVSGDKMRKVVIENGTLKVAGEVEDYNNSSFLITANELRRQYAEYFQVKETKYNVSDEELVKELDEKDNRIKNLEQELSNKDNTIDELNKKIEELQQKLNKISNLESEVNDPKGDNSKDKK